MRAWISSASRRDRVHEFREELLTARVHPVEILDQGDEGTHVRIVVLDDRAQHDKELALFGVGIERGCWVVGVRRSEELEHNRQHLAKALVEQQEPASDFLSHHPVVVLFSDAVVGAEDLEHWEVGEILAVRKRLAFESL